MRTVQFQDVYVSALASYLALAFAVRLAVNMVCAGTGLSVAWKAHALELLERLILVIVTVLTENQVTGLAKRRGQKQGAMQWRGVRGID